jgi:pimeloyl-ACP methyl ester carboxylesterase
MSESTTQPTVVLVHGTFADASSWSKVLKVLDDAGVPVQAVSNPLRSLTTDGEYVASAISQIDGPVVLVGHSYGGSTITYASSDASNVKALVFVASFGVDEGVSTLQSVEGYPSSLNEALQPATYPNGDTPGTEFYIKPEMFPTVFAGGVPADEARVLSLGQRPGTETSFFEPLAVAPGWKRLPSWFVVSGADQVINPDSQRAAAERMGATVSEIDGGSHLIMLTHVDEIVAVIMAAVESVQMAPVGAAR